MATALAFAPAHITGFFSPGVSDYPPELQGSLGAGVCFSLGVTTEVSLVPGESGVEWLDEKAPETLMVNNKVMELFQTLLPAGHNLSIRQTRAVPMGCGLGSSGAGALSLSLALNAALGYPLSPREATLAAHKAELLCQTGLGTVAGICAGGLELRVKAGAPGFGETRSLEVSGDVRLYLAILGPMPTREELNKSILMGKASKSGSVLLNRLLPDITVDNFQKLSSEFTGEMDLASQELKNMAKVLESKKVAWAMPMFGQGIFWLGPASDKSLWDKIRESAPAEAWFWTGPIDNQGARILHVI